MNPPKPVRLQKNWQQLVRTIVPDPCILLKGEGDHFILGWEVEAELKFADNQFDFDRLQNFVDRFSGRYRFGYLTYDVKNKIESRLSSSNADCMFFPEAHWMVFRHVLEHKNGQFQYTGTFDEKAIQDFFESPESVEEGSPSPIELKAKTSRESYLEHVQKIQEAIQQGMVYEMNYCVQFVAEKAQIHPLETFVRLNQLTDAPFSVYLHTGSHFVMSASPERYIRKTGDHLISQPIKGTARRSASPAEDEKLKLELRQNEKERAENIMIVDLVRNDLSRVAEKKSVMVDELCGVYSFKTVHQLISTVSCKLKQETRFTDVIKATFPMGSMTGAPKISAMQLAEEHEDFKRGLYSGTIGYMDPSGNYDFNVVIRSILYNSQAKVVSCSVGGAITINAQPEKEYDECLLKLQALQKALC